MPQNNCSEAAYRMKNKHLWTKAHNGKGRRDGYNFLCCIGSKRVTDEKKDRVQMKTRLEDEHPCKRKWMMLCFELLNLLYWTAESQKCSWLKVSKWRTLFKVNKRSKILGKALVYETPNYEYKTFPVDCPIHSFRLLLVVHIQWAHQGLKRCNEKR